MMVMMLVLLLLLLHEMTGASFRGRTRRETRRVTPRGTATTGWINRGLRRGGNVGGARPGHVEHVGGASGRVGEMMRSRIVSACIGSRLNTRHRRVARRRRRPAMLARIRHGMGGRMHGRSHRVLRMHGRREGSVDTADVV